MTTASARTKTISMLRMSSGKAKVPRIVRIYIICTALFISLTLVTSSKNILWVNTGKALVDQANDALKKDLFPVFVAEGDSNSKLTKNQHSAYLHHNFKSFAGVCQTKSRDELHCLYTGIRFAKNDAHVLNKIGYGKILHLFVSLYGDPDSKANQTIRGNVDKIVALRPKLIRRSRLTFLTPRRRKFGGEFVNHSPEFSVSEAGSAQLQALNTLINCGWRYVTRAETDQWRDGRRTLPFLETQLRDDLARINRIHVDGRAYPFSEANIDAAVRRLAERIPEGVVRANERMTDDLLRGIALPQSIGVTSREWPFKFIDWNDWRANTFQVASEYTVSEAGGPTIPCRSRSSREWHSFRRDRGEGLARFRRSGRQPANP